MDKKHWLKIAENSGKFLYMYIMDIGVIIADGVLSLNFHIFPQKLSTVLHLYSTALADPSIFMVG